MKRFMQSLCTFASLLLVLFFTALAFCGNGGMLFAQTAPRLVSIQIISFLSPFIFPLIASITGMFSASLLKKHRTERFIALQFKALFVPFAASVVILLPLQLLLDLAPKKAAVGFAAAMAQSYRRLFDVLTLTNAVATSPWFALLLFYVYALFALGAQFLLKKFLPVDSETSHSKAALLWCGALFLLVPVSPVGKVSLLETFVAYVFGFFVLSQEVVQGYLMRNRHWIYATWLSVLVLFVFLPYANLETPFIQQITVRLFTWSSVVCAITVCKRFFDTANAFSAFGARAFFSFFYFSKITANAMAVLVQTFVQNRVAQFLCVFCVSILLITALYGVLGRFAITRVLFGIKSELYNEND